ncbi:MAG TPA: hypothetical protein VJ870_00435 [Amycolatopsis sp.]|nr:hypothetical protein [Amycolatopsis sp.]
MKPPTARHMLRVLGLPAAAVALALLPGQVANATPAGDSGATTKAHTPLAGESTSDLTSPQPPSNADFSGNGANTHGPYDSTRDGSPSGNGSGNGQAIGKPCAGCVGKADNKNPPGQLPGPSDPNAGYECDTNHGIGRTNPAHTGCPTATPPGTPGTPGTAGTPGIPGTPGAPVTPIAQPVSEVIPVAGSFSGTLPLPAAQAAPKMLASTGSNVELPLEIGLGLLAAGGALYASSRRLRRSN